MSRSPVSLIFCHNAFSRSGPCPVENDDEMIIYLHNNMSYSVHHNRSVQCTIKVAQCAKNVPSVTCAEDERDSVS